QQSQLETLRATWAASEAEALASGAPAPVLDRINATVASIVAAHQMLGERLAIGVWGYFTAENLGMTGAIRSSLDSVLDARYARGSMSLSVGDVVAFVLTVAAAFLLSSVVRFVLREEIYPRSRLAHGQSYALSILLHYAVILVGFLFAAS